MDTHKAAKIIQKAWKRYNDIYLQKISWCFSSLFHHSITDKTRTSSRKRMIANSLEKIWGNKISYQKNNSNWTTKLSELLVKQVLVRKGIKNWKPAKINHLCPDLETEDFIYEIKSRNWTTNGTAGEKVLAVPFKYSDIPRLYGKPLKIVCVAYQQYELSNGSLNIFDTSKISTEKEALLAFWKANNIEFVKMTDLIKSTST